MELPSGYRGLNHVYDKPSYAVPQKFSSSWLAPKVFNVLIGTSDIDNDDPVYPSCLPPFIDMLLEELHVRKQHTDNVDVVRLDVLGGSGGATTTVTTRMILAVSMNRSPDQTRVSGALETLQKIIVDVERRWRK